VASGPDLSSDGAERAAAPMRDDGAEGDLPGVVAVVVMPGSRGILLQAHAGWW
jgi:hypothetical protein